MEYIFLLLSVGISISLTAQLPSNIEDKVDQEDSGIIFTVPLITYESEHDSKRVRRSEYAEAFINVTLPMPSEDIILRLIPAEDLMIPGATFEHRQGNVSTATPVRKDCYYQGKVADIDESFAAVSICNGLIGMYEYEGEQYSIQPVNLDKEEDNSHKLHTITRMNKTGYESMIDPNLQLSEIGRRVKRDAVEQKYLEVMVVIDQTVLEFHGEENTELFVLALFNMVNLIYGHSSLGVNIQLSLVKLVLLEKETADEMWEGDNPRDTLDKFCMWSAVNSMREHEVGHYDFAMYLSRGRMSPAGYAPVTGMCRPDRSCALIKEDGFSTSFVAAHEIGHTIGMSHDGEGTNKCVNEPKRGSIMAPLVMANLNNYFWSPCSKEEIDSILNTLYCMRDDPFDVTWSQLEMPLGQNWDLDEQCKKEFGNGFKLCSTTTHNFSPCEHLWCSTPGNRYLCKTKRAPPLPGSTCARDRWCFNSQCVVANPDDPLWKVDTIDHSRLKSIDGSWSRWSSWSGCSTSCGRGIKSRTRACNDPQPALGGRECPGESYDLRLCNPPEQMRMVCKMFSTLSYSVRRACMKHKVYYRTCKKEIDDVRLDQCTRYNKRGRTYKPFEPADEAELCLLNCVTEEQNIPLYGEIEAVDGTFCSYNDRNAMCYAGKCIDVGCDGKINSGAKEDMCGQCKGDNSKCTLRQDYYNEKLNRGYQLLVRLYPGTRNFRIKKPNDAYKLVLKNVKTNKTILSERTRKSFNVTDSGALWSFSNTRSETLECSGPLQAEYDIMIYSLYSGMRATLSITFTEPLDVVRDNDQLTTTESARQRERSRDTVTIKKYTWSADQWSKCSQPCGDGMHEQQLVCKNTRTNQTVHELLCKGEQKPTTIKKTCYVKPCEVNYRWVLSEWTKCPDDLCSISKISQRRWAFCVRESPELEERWHRVKDSFCSLIEPPVLIRPCNKSSCSEPGYWETGQFSPCSTTCGRGRQEREVACVPINPSSSYSAQCDIREKPSASEECMQQPCTLSTTNALETSQQSTTQISLTTPAEFDFDQIRESTTAFNPLTSTTEEEIDDSHILDKTLQEKALPEYSTMLAPYATRATVSERDDATTTSAITLTEDGIVVTMVTAQSQKVTKNKTPKITTPKISMEPQTTLGEVETETTTGSLPATTQATTKMADSTTILETTTTEDAPLTTTRSVTSTALIGSSALKVASSSVAVTRPEKTTLTPKFTNQPMSSTQTSDSTTTSWWSTTSQALSSTSKFVWWWTAKTEATTSSSARTRFIWWWTSPTSPPTTTQSIPSPTATTKAQTTEQITTLPKTIEPESNELPDNNADVHADVQIACKRDMSSICKMMDNRRCKLLLFQRLCCRACLNFL